MYKYQPRKRRRALKGHVLPDERTERLRRRVRWRRVFISLGIIAGLALAALLFRSPLLRVQEVEVVGAKNVAAQQIAELADLEGASMISPPLNDAEARIVALPLIKGVRATRVWPGKVRVEVIERAPWGYWNLAGKSHVIDGDGVILPDVKPAKGAPVIHDVGLPADLGPGDRVDADAVALAQLLLTLVPEKLALKIAHLEYAPETGVSLVTNADYRVVIGDSQDVDYKLAVWKVVEDDMGRAAMAGHALDLRFRDRPSFQ